MASNPIPSDISFEGSYVLGICITPYVLELKMELLLMPDHGAYSKPKAGERECFRRGIMRIAKFRNMEWSATGFSPAHDASGEPDWGCLDEFFDGEWQLAAGWRLGCHCA